MEDFEDLSGWEGHFQCPTNGCVIRYEIDDDNRVQFSDAGDWQIIHDAGISPDEIKRMESEVEDFCKTCSGTWSENWNAFVKYMTQLGVSRNDL